VDFIVAASNRLGQNILRSVIADQIRRFRIRRAERLARTIEELHRANGHFDVALLLGGKRILDLLTDVRQSNRLLSNQQVDTNLQQEDYDKDRESDPEIWQGEKCEERAEQ